MVPRKEVVEEGGGIEGTFSPSGEPLRLSKLGNACDEEV